MALPPERVLNLKPVRPTGPAAEFGQIFYSGMTSIALMDG
jgi:hypothetical protein